MSLTIVQANMNSIFAHQDTTVLCVDSSLAQHEVRDSLLVFLCLSAATNQRLHTASLLLAWEHV